MGLIIWTVVAIFLATFFVLRKIFKYSQRNERDSQVTKFPGPINIPGFGSLPHILLKIKNPMTLSSFELFSELKRVWGSPISIQIGNYRTVMIDDLKLTKKLMSSEEWSNRICDDPLLMKRSFGQHYGLLMSNGESWKEMRRYIHKTLTKFGFGRSSALEMRHEEEIMTVFKYLDNKLEKSNGIVQMQGIFNVSALNILWTMIASTRFDYESEEISQLTELLEEFARAIHPKELTFLAFPFLRHIPGATGYDKVIGNSYKMQEHFRKIINERRALGEYKTEQNNFIDAFLHEIDCHKDNKTEPNYYTDEQLIMVLVDLFLTGFIPTASSLEFLIMFMILNPNIQKKCQEEIDSVIGKNRYPSINDSESLPYVQAVCIEVLRKVTFIPMTTRSATKDTFLDGVFVPKGTIAAINLYSIHNNPDVWDNPEEFCPERFLDENGKVANQETILPFGTGKRVCPAEVFGRLSSFTYFAYLLQRYTFEVGPNSPIPDPTPNVGLGNYPKPFDAVIRRR